MNKIASFDIDGVIFNNDWPGVYPGPHDIIITGRSYEEFQYTNDMLKNKGIHNQVFYNPSKFDDKTRIGSGEHKAYTINLINSKSQVIYIHYEDDEVQADVIKNKCPNIKVFLIKSDIVEKENVWHE